MAETYSAGVVTAYGAAVRGGYTGTYEEFCAEQAKFAENAAAVAQAKEDVETMQGQVEQAAATFTDTTVPAAVTTVQEAGAAQVQAVQSEGTIQAEAVETVGAQQTAAVGAAGSDAVDAVEAAETAATDAVTAAQTAAVQAVQTESSTQQAAIQTKGQETIASIPEDYTALSGEVDDLKSANDLLTNDVFKNENFIRGKFLNSNDVVTDNIKWCITDYVPVTSGTRITCVGGAIPADYSLGWIIEYDQNKTLVDYWGVPKDETGRYVDLSASTVFVRMGFVLGYNARISNNSTGEIIWHPESEGLYGAKEDIKTANADIAQVFTASGIISATFHPGLATANGTINATSPAYANATDIISYPYDLLISAENGYQFFLQLFNSDGTFNRTIGWQTDKYTLSANQKFAITVAHNPLNTTYNAVENEFRLGVKIGRVNKQWEGKKWYAFGTSISDTTFPMPYDLPGVTGKYPPFLVQLSGLIHTNFALGGSRITNAATADRTTILQKILATDLSDADIITIDGFVNDFGACEIGDLESLTPENADDTTLFGAMFLAITHCLQNSNAVVCLLTDNTGKIWTTPQGQTHPTDLRPWKKDGHGKTQNDYQDAMRKIAKYLGCYCIDAGSMASINYCHPEYLQDTIHQSEAGGKQYANAIWSVLKDIQPNVART